MKKRSGFTRFLHASLFLHSWGQAGARVSLKAFSCLPWVPRDPLLRPPLVTMLQQQALSSPPASWPGGMLTLLAFLPGALRGGGRAISSGQGAG